ncbi:hypothetical protein [Streptomyces sp. NPDC001851]|uniref:hypothetical protein n=1 Tax=Streptomyces sp. NPDC001851 TaxID=3154529 RepID=UPI00331724AA
MRMKDMVARTGVHQRLLRYYEAGPPHSEAAAKRLPGFSTAVIAQALPCLTDDESAAGLAPA